jgi:hypothetical protein
MNDVSVDVCPRPDVYNHHFSEEECDAFFRLSGDVNHQMHSLDGMRIVQGALVFMVVATCISKSFPGFGLKDFDQAVFKKPLLIGDSISIILQLVRSGSKIKRVNVRVRRRDEQVVEDVVVTLVHFSKMLR